MGGLGKIVSEAIVSTKISLKKTSTPPSIDGDLNDPAWKDSATITDFKRYNIKEGDPPTEKLGKATY